MPVWREKKGSRPSCCASGRWAQPKCGVRTQKRGTLAKLNKIEKHEALGNLAAPAAKDYTWMASA